MSSPAIYVANANQPVEFSVAPGLQTAAACQLAGQTARRNGRFDEAERCLSRACELAPTDAPTWFERATACFQAGKLTPALEYYQRATELDRNLGEAFLNVGGVLEQLERQAEGLPYAERAVELLPRNAVAHYNLANIYRALANLPAALRSFERALALDPAYDKVRWNMATCHLLQGNFQAGWQEYEWRSAVGAVALDRYPQPRWDGSSLAGKTLLVHAEQGIGDEILFASCLPDVMAQAAHVILICDPRLVALFRRSFAGLTVYGHQRLNDGQPCAVAESVDCQIPAGSLPLYVRRTLSDFPRRRHFLTADPQQVATWRDRFAALGPGLKIGISWRAGGRTSERRRRTTEFERWQGLFAQQGVHWINLQYGDADEEIAAARENCGIEIHDWPDGDPLVDLDGFAARLSALDLVISVGNATTHMAGALGAPAWVLLPVVPAWRWMIAGERSPWYESLKLYRQTSLGDWTAPFAALESELAQLVVDRNVTVSRPHFALMTPVHRFTKTDNERFDAVQDDRILADVVIPKVLEEAIAKHRAGQYAEAETVYRQILRRAPRHPDALHLLGVLARQTGRLELAMQSMHRALAICPTEPSMHFNLGNALADAQHYREAIASFRRALALNPNFAEAEMNLGLALVQTGQTSEAIASLRAAAGGMARSVEAQYNLGKALEQTCQIDEACECYENAIGLDPQFSKTYFALANLLADDGRPEEALLICRGGLNIAPSNASGHQMLATTLRKLERLDEARAAYARALELEPNRLDTLHNLAHLHLEQGAAANAELLCRQALAVHPKEPHTLNTLGQALEDQARWNEALRCYSLAAEADPNYPLARCNAALVRLQLGDLEHGWDDYEARWSCPDGPRARNYFSQPPWDGSSLAGKTLLIHGEQGLGDEILFATCVPDILRMGARVVLACDPRLAPLFRRSLPTTIVLPMRRSQEHLLQVPAELSIDFQIASGSLPRFVRRDATKFQPLKKLLRVDSERLALWRERLAALGPGLKVGISWRAGNSNKDRRTRWTKPELWTGLLQTAGAHFINLQYGDCEHDLAQFKQLSGVEVHSWADCDPKQHIDELASQIAALDLVISVANANVHLAGALGVPAWALVPTPPRWSWGSMRGNRSQWYASVNIVRQHVTGDWSEAFAYLKQILSAEIH